MAARPRLKNETQGSFGGGGGRYRLQQSLTDLWQLSFFNDFNVIANACSGVMKRFRKVC